MVATTLSAVWVALPSASLADEGWPSRLASAHETLADLRARMVEAQRADREQLAAAARARHADREALAHADQEAALEAVRRFSRQTDASGARMVIELRRAREGDPALTSIPGWPRAAEAPAGDAAGVASLEEARRSLDRELRRSALEMAARHEAAAVDANLARVAAIAAAPRPDAITSPGGEGWAEARREVLLARRRVHLRVEEVRAFWVDRWSHLRDPATGFRLLAIAVELALALAGVRLLRQVLGLLAKAPAAPKGLRRTAIHRFRELAADGVRGGQRPLAAFLGIALLRWLLGSDAEGPFLGLILECALWVSGSFAAAGIAEAIFVGASDWADDDDDADDAGRRSRPAVDLPGLAVGRARALRRAALLVSAWVASSITIETLMGDGVLASWLDTAALVAAPLLLAALSWTMRHTVSVRLERLARDDPDSRLLGWIVRNRTKVWRFVPLSIGVLVVGVWTVAGWIMEQASGFDVTRRALAWTFRRRVGARLQEGAGLAPLDEASCSTFRPEGPPLRTLARVEKSLVDQLTATVTRGRGGIFAIVGERGLGKSAILARVTQAVGDSSILQAVVRRGGDPVADVRAELHADLDTTGAVLAARLEDSPYVAVFLDDVHRAVAPRVGGLDAFDALVAIARESSRETCWVLTFERTSWEFIARARASEPIFDEVFFLEPWGEADIAQLVRSRTAVARLKTSFAGLGEAAHAAVRGPGALRAEADFYRTLWDYALGNPAVALLFWRASLFTDAAGVAQVRLFQAPEPDDLESLPDDARFVLRALIQLEHAAPEEIRRATLLDEREVRSALRLAIHRGLVEPVPGDRDGRLRISWNHYRAVTRFLRRKHLLTAV